MANSFFGFDTSSHRRENISSPGNDDCIETEQEYDALNDETFGGFEDSNGLDDWEQIHEEFAEYAEHSKQSDDIENSLSKLVFDDCDVPNLSKKDSVWAYTQPPKNGDIINTSLLHILEKPIESKVSNDIGKGPIKFHAGVSPIANTAVAPKKICTVEELERGLMNSRVVKPVQGPIQPPVPHPMFPQAPGGNRFPPGLPYPMGMVPPPGGGRHHYMQPPMPPHYMRPPPPGHPMFRGPPPPGINFPPGNYPMNHHHQPPHHPFNFPPPPRNSHHPHPHMLPPHPSLLQNQNHNNHHHNNNNNNNNGRMAPQQQMQSRQRRDSASSSHSNSYQSNNGPYYNNQQSQQQSQQQQSQQQSQQLSQQQQRQRYDSGGGGGGGDYNGGDEYAGLMSNREKQWLLNIQLLQLNTGTPYFDDYYYTVFKERKVNHNENQNLLDRNQRFPYNNRQHNRDGRNNDRQQENSNSMQARVYTPLQFENSLGKLQCGSVTAPRKIIDTDIVLPHDTDPNSSSSSSTTLVTPRDIRRTKQLLLELESLYTLLLRAEDLRNPVALANGEKLRELKQRQRLRELDVAATSEQKQEILRLLREESEVTVGGEGQTPGAYIVKVAAGFGQEDKVASYMNIRKGKMLLLRLLPHLTSDLYLSQLGDIWMKVLLSIPGIGRRDTAGDNLLPQLHPYFKRYVQSCTMSDILEIVSNLIEVVRPENSRSTPLSHQGRSPLHFVVTNKFGISAVVTLLVRCEYLLTSGNTTDPQRSTWATFIASWAEVVASVINTVAQPIELIPGPIFLKHSNRLGERLLEEQRVLLERCFVDTS